MISVSGIRGIVGESLTPSELVSFAQAYATWLNRERQSQDSTGSPAAEKPKVVIGRDTRPTGHAINSLICGSMALCGCSIVDIGIATTPTVELATTAEQADGGIVITASHNPVEWNALKLLDRNGEFLTQEQLDTLLDIFTQQQFSPAGWQTVGNIEQKQNCNSEHISRILALDCIDTGRIAAQRYRVLIDAVEGAGSEIVPELCRQLGVERIETINCSGTGIFPRNPEPLAKHLVATVEALKETACDLAVVVDPDVDRLALVCEDGSLFGEEYSLVACADFYLRYKKGPVVNNLSSSRALRDIAEKHNQDCHSAKVGEANVVAVMKQQKAVIGGEGNGGIILPELHYGRDALVGTALFLQAFTRWREENDLNRNLSDFRKLFPEYHMAKKKVRLAKKPDNLDELINEIATGYPDAAKNTLDGLKLDFPDEWVHLRASNTEPALRIYTEAPSLPRAEQLAEIFTREITSRIDSL